MSNPTCNGTYIKGQNFWIKNGYEDSAHPQTLTNFVTEMVAAYPDSSAIVLSLVGHGSGWTAHALPGQPSKWRPQPGAPEYEERVGGLLWDDTPGNGGTSRSMSTKALGVALGWIKSEIDKPIDLLYLDSCSMGMAEVGYEIHNSVQYLLASPNTAWASFAYGDMLQATNGSQNGQQIGEAWINAEAAALDNGQYPYTLSLIEVNQVAELPAKISALADLLNGADVGKIKQAFTEANHYESDYNGILEVSDSYVDLSSFAARIEKVFVGNADIINAAQALSDTIQNVVVTKYAYRNGRPWIYPDQEWTWNEPGGLAIYLPLAENDVKRMLYTDGHLRWAKDTTWDEFLAGFWGETMVAADIHADELPTCESTRNCEQLAEQLALETFTIYLPTIQGGSR